MRRAVLALLLVGCSYDWAVSSPADGGRDVLSPADVSVADSSDATSHDDAGPTDATTEPIADTAPTDSSVTPEVDAAECQQLLQNAMNALGPALDCTPGPTACMAQTHDWCGCPLYLADGTSPAYGAFVMAMTMYDAANCRYSPDIFCADACFKPIAGDCIIYDAGPGKYRCYY